MLVKLNNKKFLCLQRRRRPKLVLICNSDNPFYKEGVAPKEYYMLQGVRVDNFKIYENQIEKVILFEGRYFSGKNFRNVFEIEEDGNHVLVAEFWIHHDGYCLMNYEGIKPIWMDQGGSRNRGAKWYIFKKEDITQII